MDNDSNRPIPPPDRSPSGQEPLLSKQHSGHYATPSVPSPREAQRSGKGRIFLWIGLALLLICVGGILVAVHRDSSPSPTSVTNHYYSAIEKQDYDTAFQDLDPRMQSQEQHDLFIQLGRSADGADGEVTNYSITNIALSVMNGADTADVTLHITRTSTVRGNLSYDVHLLLQKEDDNWKIISSSPLPIFEQS